jgi:hypothetical protein
MQRSSFAAAAKAELARLDLLREHASNQKPGG